MLSPELRINERCLLTELADGSGVLLHLETKFYYTLNASGVAVWKSVAAGAGDTERAAQFIVDAYDVDPVTAQRDVAEVLDYMLGEGLVLKG
jgi:hypothetical protein